VLPIVLYNGSQRWSAKQDIYEMVQPKPPAFLRVYQPHLRYYLVDEGRYTDAELGLHPTPLSGMFSVENAGDSWAALQRAVDRIVAIIQADPNRERIDRVVTRWIKRHLSRLGAEVNLDQLNSLVEDKNMLAENLENLVKKERLMGEQIGMRKGEQIGIQQGIQRGRMEGRLETMRETARNLIAMNLLTDAQIAQASGLSEEEVAALRSETRH
jgi:mRNA-degrading endonuclease toxin of MazEF toxin-antitoxin module